MICKGAFGKLFDGNDSGLAMEFEPHLPETSRSVRMRWKAQEEETMSKLLAFLARERRLWQQKREIQALQAEVEKLRVQNERLRTAMRRCLTCEYRGEVEGRG